MDIAKNLSERVTKYFLKSTTGVGCVILTPSGIACGHNFDYEWGVTRHAEDVAICSMIMLQEKPEILIVYLYADVDQLTPCGSCIDKIRRFGSDNTIIYVGNSKEIKEYKLSDLMPHYPRR